MKDLNHSKDIDSRNELTKVESNSSTTSETNPVENKNTDLLDDKKKEHGIKSEASSIPKKPLKPPKLEEKPFEEFICDNFIPGIKSSIEEKGTLVSEIEFIKA